VTSPAARFALLIVDRHRRSSRPETPREMPVQEAAREDVADKVQDFAGVVVSDIGDAIRGLFG
jgi:hypothetical protein